MVFSIDKVKFTDDDKLSVTFHGTKNDHHRDGVNVTIPKSSDIQVDPVETLSAYIARTKLQRLASHDKGVFLTLVQPFRAISSSSVSTILTEAIGLAGLSGKGFSAKSFRPTAATQAVAAGCDTDIARQVGRWKSREVFEEHYVHTRTPDNYMDLILDV